MQHRVALVVAHHRGLAARRNLTSNNRHARLRKTGSEIRTELINKLRLDRDRRRFLRPIDFVQTCFFINVANVDLCRSAPNSLFDPKKNLIDTVKTARSAFCAAKHRAHNVGVFFILNLQCLRKNKAFLGPLSCDTDTVISKKLFDHWPDLVGGFSDNDPTSFTQFLDTNRAVVLTAPERSWHRRLIRKNFL